MTDVLSELFGSSAPVIWTPSRTRVPLIPWDDMNATDLPVDYSPVSPDILSTLAILAASGPDKPHLLRSDRLRNLRVAARLGQVVTVSDNVADSAGFIGVDDASSLLPGDIIDWVHIGGAGAVTVYAVIITAVNVVTNRIKYTAGTIAGNPAGPPSVTIGDTLIAVPRVGLSRAANEIYAAPSDVQVTLNGGTATVAISTNPVPTSITNTPSVQPNTSLGTEWATVGLVTSRNTVKIDPANNTVTISGQPVGISIQSDRSVYDALADSGEPAVSTLASATIAGVSGKRNVCRMIRFEIVASNVAPAATVVRCRIRDGAVGVGSILQSWTMGISNVAGQQNNIELSGLGIAGSVGNAMSCEFSSLIANAFESCGIGVNQQ